MGREFQAIRSLGELEAHILDVGVVWGYSPGDGSRAASGFHLAPLILGSPSHPHRYMFSNLRFAIPGHDGVLAGTDLRSSESRSLGWLPLLPDLLTSKVFGSGVPPPVRAMGWATSGKCSTRVLAEYAYQQQRRGRQAAVRGG